MHCTHCGFANGEDDHRCLRCGRRIQGAGTAAQYGYSGANALATAVMTSVAVEELPQQQQATAVPAAPVQPGLFAPPSANVIPFERVQRDAAGRPATQAPVHFMAPEPQTALSATHRAAGPRKVPAPGAQGTLDFVAASPAKGRKLQNDVDAQVFCDRPVAGPVHRLIAFAIDAFMTLIGFAALVTIFEVMGGDLGSGKQFWIDIGAALALVAFFYGSVWAIAGRETAGMRITDLELITFDGFAVDPRSRALRFASSWLSFCCGGLGLFWALVDEENLAWHDHISRTFPAIREAPGTFVRQRR